MRPSPSLLRKLADAWSATPALTFGQLVESVENVTWDMVPERYSSARLAALPDHVFETALDQWIGMPAVRKVVGHA